MRSGRVKLFNLILLLVTHILMIPARLSLLLPARNFLALVLLVISHNTEYSKCNRA